MVAEFRAEGAEAVLSVANPGVVISEEQLERLFRASTSIQRPEHAIGVTSAVGSTSWPGSSRRTATV